MKQPLKYKHFLRQTGRADGQLARIRWNEYRRRHALMAYVGSDPATPIKSRIYEWLRRQFWLVGVLFRTWFGVTRIHLARPATRAGGDAVPKTRRAVAEGTAGQPRRRGFQIGEVQHE